MTTTTLLPRSIAAGLTAAVLAVGLTTTASAKPPSVPGVPKDKIEHVVHEVTITGKYPRHERQELFLTADESRMVVRDADTGKLVSENTWDDGVSKIYDAERNLITELRDRETTPPYQSLAQEAAAWRDALAKGAVKQVGETTVGDRAALQLQSAAGTWKSDVPTDKGSLTVDKETFTVYAITTSPGPEFAQTVELEKAETLPRTASTERLLDMAKHAGAKTEKAGAATKKSKKAKKKAAKKRRHR